MEPDRRYFDNLLQSHDISLRTLAKRMGMSHSQLSLAFSGARKLQIEEAVQIASIFGEPLSRIIEALGIQTTAMSRVTVSSILRGDGTIEPNPEPERTYAPEGMPDGSYAIQARTAGTALDYLDGALFFARKSDRVDPESIGRVSILHIADGPAVVATPRRGYRSSTFNLSGFFTRDNAALVSASPVLWIRP